MGQRGFPGAASPRTRRKSNALALTKDLKICAAAAAVFIPVFIHIAGAVMSSINPQKSSFSGNRIGVPAAPKNGIVLNVEGHEVTQVRQDNKGNYDVTICTNPNTAASNCSQMEFPKTAGDLMVEINDKKMSLAIAARGI